MTRLWAGTVAAMMGAFAAAGVAVVEPWSRRGSRHLRTRLSLVVLYGFGEFSDLGECRYEGFLSRFQLLRENQVGRRQVFHGFAVAGRCGC